MSRWTHALRLLHLPCILFCTCSFLLALFKRPKIVLKILNNGARYTRAQIQINTDPKWSCQAQIIKTACTRWIADLDSHLCCVTQYDFYLVLKRDAIRVRLLLCAYVHLRANCCFQIYSTSSYLRSVENFTQIQIDLALAWALRIRIDPDPCSRVASPTLNVMWTLSIAECNSKYLLSCRPNGGQ